MAFFFFFSSGEVIYLYLYAIEKRRKRNNLSIFHEPIPKIQAQFKCKCRPNWAEMAHCVLHGRPKRRESEFLNASSWKIEIQAVEKGGHLDRPIQFELRRWSPCPPPSDLPPSSPSSFPSSYAHFRQSSPPSMIIRYGFSSFWSLHFFPFQLARKSKWRR